MTIDDEAYFPRGGAGKKEKSLKRAPYVFQPKKKNLEKKKKPGKRERNKQKTGQVAKIGDNSDDESAANDSVVNVSETAESPEPRLRKTQPLQYRDLAEGFVSLCSVQSVLKCYIRVSLPERLLATVKWTDISTPLSQTERRGPCKIPDLEKLFKVDDVLACRIKSVSGKGTNFEVSATTDPAELNRDTSCDSVLVGSVFFGAVQSVEDHGYMVFSGISGLNAFLPFENCKSFLKHRKLKSFPVGKLLWCIVTKSDVGDLTNNVQVAVDEEYFGRLEPAASKILTPGNRLDLIVTKHLNEKVQVSDVGKNFHGFIPRSHLRSFNEDISEEYQVGAKLIGSVLYKFPVTNVAAFSLKVEPARKLKQIVETGEVFQTAEICWHEHRGIGVKFEHRGVLCYGFVSRKRMEGSVESKSLKELFPKGNHISVVVIGYHHIDKLYTCSTQDEILTGKFLMVKQLKEMVGKLVTVEVKSKNEKGAVVAIDNRTAFVPVTQVTDVKCLKPLEKLKINSKHQGRVLRFDPEKNSILVTLRPTLVNNKPLTDFKHAKRGDSYYGSVASIGEDKITVAFFNALKAEILQENLIEDCRKYSVGTLLKCHVIKEKTGYTPPRFSLVRSVDQMVLSIGSTYKLIVKAKDATGIECLLGEGSTVQNVKIPKEYLCDHEKLQTKTLERLAPGSTVDAQLFCYDSFLNPVFTMRDSVRRLFAEGGERLKTKGLAALAVKTLIPAIVADVTEDGVYVWVPVPMYNGKVLVDKNAFDEEVSVNDLIWLSVKRINIGGKQIFLERPSIESHKEELQKWAVENLISYLNEIATFLSYKPNDVVSVVLKEENHCQLPDGRKGIILPVMSNKSSVTVTGRRLTVLFEERGAKEAVYLADSKLPSPSETIDPQPKEFEVIHVNKMFFICKSADNTVCYVPRFLSPSSTKPDVKKVAIGRLLMVKPIRVENGLLFGCLLPSISEQNHEDVRAAEDESSLLDASVGKKKTRKRKREKKGKDEPSKKHKRPED
ncbi:Programmed cell death protein [Nesidiocoris tenuis]|uniref:Programmed cell death protein n=1 Tax=Nesidiocoris tenuis TaxID=355587 RepID=A0ABN7AUW8_9HEMI|nr:Programmed cell death protein [Nesidiocoris tenuis]